MPAASRHEGDHHFVGTVTMGAVTLPDSAVTNAKVAAGAAIDASKVNHQFTVNVELCAPNAAITAKSTLLHIVRGATGVVVAAEAIITTVASGGDRTVTVDIQKATGGGAFATICSATIDITNGTTVRVPVSATINDDDLEDGDSLQAVVTVAGVAGAQAQGLLLSLTLQETPN